MASPKTFIRFLIVYALVCVWINEISLPHSMKKNSNAFTCTKIQCSIKELHFSINKCTFVGFSIWKMQFLYFLSCNFSSFSNLLHHFCPTTWNPFRSTISNEVLHCMVVYVVVVVFFLFSTLHLRERLTNNDLKNINNEPGERERNRKGLLQSLFRFQVEYSLIQTAFVCILAFIFAGVFNFKWHKQSRGF